MSLIGRTGHRLCTFSTSIREIREIKYYFNIRGIRKKKKKGAQKKGGENSPISPPLDPRLLLYCIVNWISCFVFRDETLHPSLTS